MSDLHGRDFRAKTRLTTKDGVVAAVGQTCERVPAHSLPWLLAQGRIERIEPTRSRRAPAAAAAAPATTAIAPTTTEGA